MDKEIIWNIINSLLAGSLVFLGGFTTGNINLDTITFSLVAGLVAAIVQFKDYWQKEEEEYKGKKLFQFL